MKRTVLISSPSTSGGYVRVNSDQELWNFFLWVKHSASKHCLDESGFRTVRKKSLNKCPYKSL